MASQQQRGTWTRRQALGTGLAGAVGATMTLAVPSWARAARSGDSGSTPSTPFTITPFVDELPSPPVLQPVDPFLTERAFPPDQIQFPVKYYEVRMRRGTTRVIPNVETEIWGYNGIWPGPTIRARLGEPVVVRHINELDGQTAVHLHGAHPPAESDGYPGDLIDPGAFRDYGYPNFSAGAEPGQSLSTIWYHDHAQDITGLNVYHGLAGFYLVRDDLESALIDAGTLPGEEFDLALALQDRVLNLDGSLFFDPLNHDGFLGDVFCVNGKAQPFANVRRRQYRLRVLNGSNARFYMVRLSTGAPFLVVGTDSALLPAAVRVPSVLLAPAERVDIIVDFRNAPDEVFLENIVVQTDGRGPGGDSLRPDVRIPGVPLLKFVVNPLREDDNVRVQAGAVIRPMVRIRPDEIVATRRFEFGRSQGAWTINNRFFDPDVPVGEPKLGSAERWIIVNKSGGWWHPIHIHQELHQVQSFSGRTPPPLLRGNKDTTTLGPNDTAELFIKFRDFPGRWVFHCHNIAHEDMAMMARFDVVGG
jgi:FtsP/CotA-like multicopper oxidase with cupredoxin domain